MVSESQRCRFFWCFALLAAQQAGIKRTMAFAGLNCVTLASRAALVRMWRFGDSVPPTIFSFDCSRSHRALSSTTYDFDDTSLAEALREPLQSLDMDAFALADAARRSRTTTEGYDPRFGKPAIRAYLSFLKGRFPENDVSVAATRTARQIDFLVKRHRSREAEHVRHTDVSETRTLFPLVLLLDNVRSAFNVGSIFRTADACGCREVITVGITPHPRGSGKEKLAKSALGAESVVQTRHFPTISLAIATLRDEAATDGIMMVGMETTERSRLYTDVTYNRGPLPNGDCGVVGNVGGTVLVLGNEVTGVNTEIMDSLDEVVEVPMFGRKNSLNIAACAPVVMYEVLRQWGVFNKQHQADEEFGVSQGN